MMMMMSNPYFRTSYHNYPPAPPLPLYAPQQQQIMDVQQTNTYGANNFMPTTTVQGYPPMGMPMPTGYGNYPPLPMGGGLPFPMNPQPNGMNGSNTGGYLPAFNNNQPPPWMQQQPTYTQPQPQPTSGNYVLPQPVPMPPYVPTAPYQYNPGYYSNQPPAVDHCMPPLPPPPPPQIVGANENAVMWGDPHIGDADRADKANNKATSFDVTDPGVFNVLEDKDVQLNANFEKFPQWGPTVTTEIGLNLKGNKVYIGKDGSTMVNGQALVYGKNITLPDGATVSVTGNKVKVATNPNSGEYDMEFEVVDSGQKNPDGSAIKYIDTKVSSRDKGVLFDGQAPKGILGEGFDADGEERKALKLGGADLYKAPKLVADDVAPSPLPPAPPPQPSPYWGGSAFPGMPMLNDGMLPPPPLPPLPMPGN